MSTLLHQPKLLPGHLHTFFICPPCPEPETILGIFPVSGCLFLWWSARPLGLEVWNGAPHTSQACKPNPACLTLSPCTAGMVGRQRSPVPLFSPIWPRHRIQVSMHGGSSDIRTHTASLHTWHIHLGSANGTFRTNEYYKSYTQTHCYQWLVYNPRVCVSLLHH